MSPEAAAPELPPLRRTRGLDEGTVRTLVAWATRAPSGGNCQPWTFTFDGERLALRHDARRSEGVLDVDGRASQLAFGAVLENVALVCPALGLRPRFVPFPDPGDPAHVCDVVLSVAPGADPVDPLVAAIPARVTNRRIGARRALDPGHRERMTRAARHHGCDVRWLEAPSDLDAVAAVLGRVDRLRMLSRTMHAEMMAELRWSPAEVERTRDGLDVATLELPAPDLAGMRVIRSWPVMRTVGAVGGGAGLERPTRKAVAGAAAVGLLTVPGVDAASFLRAGRALQRLWLSATADGVAFQPMTAATYLFHRLVHADGAGLADAERTELAALRREHVRLFGVPAGHGEPMLFRVGYAPAPTAHSLRRAVGDVLGSVRSSPCGR